jgi:hypothetical protein
VRADVYRYDEISFDVKNDPQIPFDFSGINDGPQRAESLCILCERKRESNGFSLKIAKAFRTHSCCWTDSLPKLRQNVRVAMKRYFTDR